MDFEKLVGAIHQVHAEPATLAKRAVNVSLTLRNWMIVCYITEYEQNGAGRAKYGDRFLADPLKVRTQKAYVVLKSASCGTLVRFTGLILKFGRQCLPK